MAVTLTGGFWVAAIVLLALVAFLWVTDPRHVRTRRALAPVAQFIVGLAIRLGLRD